MKKHSEPITHPDRGEIEDAIQFLEKNGVIIRHRGISSVDVLRRALVSIVKPHPRSYPAMEADIIGLAIGIPDMGGMKCVADKHGVTAGAISKRVHSFVEDNGLPPSCYMNSKEKRRAVRC